MYQKLGIAAERFTSARNLHRALQKQPPDFFVGEIHLRLGQQLRRRKRPNLDVTLNGQRGQVMQSSMYQSG